MPFFFSMLTIGLQKRRLPVTPLHMRGNINVIRCLMGLVLKIENILDVKKQEWHACYRPVTLQDPLIIM